MDKLKTLEEQYQREKEFNGSPSPAKPGVDMDNYENLSYDELAEIRVAFLPHNQIL